MRFRDSYDENIVTMAPFFLLPSTFPRREFVRVNTLQPLINLLTHRVAHDHAFLEDTLKG